MLIRPNGRIGIARSLKRSDSKGCLRAIAVTASRDAQPEYQPGTHVILQFHKLAKLATIVIKRVVGSSPTLGATPSVKKDFIICFEYRVVKRYLHLYSRPLRRPNTEIWCNGSTKDFGSFS